jgi:transcriptional regulator GlxA family with amidase domain
VTEPSPSVTLGRMARVIIVVFDGVQSLDATGPAEVFASAARASDAARYKVELGSMGGGDRTTSSGIRIGTRDLASMRPRRDDLVIVAGGGERAVREATDDRVLLEWLVRARRVVSRIASVCSGAFILGAAGILDGKRATTHWLGCDELARSFPRVTVDRNAIFVRDGSIWTSAGVTTGIDMALAMVEEDLGKDVADAVAAGLVLYVRRPGFQSQFSDALVAQTGRSDPLGPAIAWARGNLEKANVESLARRAGLSVRTLHRRCTDVLETTPARLLDKLRVEHARTLLSTSTLPVKALAAQAGFGNAVRMKRAFERELGIGPREYRLLHGAGLE